MAVNVVRWVIAHAPRDLRPSEMLVAMLLAEHAMDDGCHAYPSVASLQAESRLGERTIRLALRQLVRRGVIAVECPATNRLPTMYRFPAFRGADSAPPRGATDAPQVDSGVQDLPLGVQNLPLGVQKTTSRGAKPAPNPSEEPSSEPPEEPSEGARTRARPKRRSAPIPEDWQPDEALLGWCEKKGFSAAEVALEAERFVNYWLSREVARADWNAGFRNWMLMPFRQGGGAPAGAGPAANGRDGGMLAHLERKRAERARASPEPPDHPAAPPVDARFRERSPT